MSDKSKNKLEFIINFIYLICIAGIVFFVFRYCIGLLMPFILAFCLVAIIHSIIKAVTKKLKIKKEILSVVVLVMLYLLIGGGIFWLIAQIIFLLKEAFTIIPAYFQSSVLPMLTNFLASLEKIFNNNTIIMGINLESVKESLLTGLQNLVVAVSQRGVSFFSSFTNNIPRFLIGLIFTIVLSFFISLQFDQVLIFLKNQLPNKTKIFLIELRSIMVNTIFKYLRAYLILMIITFIELAIGLMILRTPHSIGAAAGIAIFDALPLVGTGAIMIPWTIIELFQGNYTFGIGIAVVYGVITIIRNIIEPKIVGDQLGINPIVSLMAIYLGNRLMGILGMIIFPMLAQILIVLHKNGSIQLFKGIGSKD